MLRVFRLRDASLKQTIDGIGKRRPMATHEFVFAICRGREWLGGGGDGSCRLACCPGGRACILIQADTAKRRVFGAWRGHGRGKVVSKCVAVVDGKKKGMRETSTMAGYYNGRVMAWAMESFCVVSFSGTIPTQ